MNEQEKREKAIRVLEGNYKNFVLRHNRELVTVNEILNLLKAQEPVKPTEPDEDNMVCCGACGSPVGYEVLEPSGMDYVRYNYCPNCGRAVKWE